MDALKFVEIQRLLELKFAMTDQLDASQIVQGIELDGIASEEVQIPLLFAIQYAVMDFEKEMKLVMSHHLQDAWEIARQ